ncbi:MAG: tetratricopeptide repeat protein [Rhodospirillales bacterium]|nr:tetratricopeptide repeat protein [Rhodospirillales bacterium]
MSDPDSDGRNAVAASIRQSLDLAIEHHTTGNLSEAERLYKQVLQSEPKNPEALHLLGAIAIQVGRSDVAVDLISRALSFKPDYAEAQNALGIAFNSLGKLDSAVEKFNKAIAIKPTYAEAYGNLGSTLQRLGQFDEAVASFQKSIAINAGNPSTHYNLGNALKEAGRLQEAETSFLLALDINPDYALAHNNLGTLYKDLGRLEGAAGCYQKALDADPTYADAHSNLLMTAQYRHGHDAQSLYRLHCQWDKQHAGFLGKPFADHDNLRDPDKRLRVGFVSADLRRHPIGYFLIGLLENANKDDLELICFCDGKHDDLSDRLQSAADGWLNCQGMATMVLAERIHSEKIDILFDLAGHTAANRLPLFALKPCPLQVSWAGYVGATGLKAMDYLLSDNHYTPENEHCFYREKILDMADAYVCYEPPSYAPEVGPLPCRQADFVTFGCFNNPAKINDEVLTAWADILKSVANSRLFLKYKGIDDDFSNRRIVAALTGRGVERSRVILEGGATHQAFLDSYNKVDIALDTFPYSGGLTTCEALWMGTPVVTFPGKTFASRHALSYLKTIGLDDLVACDKGGYVDLAVRLANDGDGLATLRSGLREKVARSPLCDREKFARGFTTKMRDIWRQWCGMPNGESDVV